ncbi:MAG: aminodeoxychorismate synthase component I [Candidatus Contendobacter sp.]|jgi:para-aminobenzoate synthetase/4-amino-4-deoxychorismate lyase|nr:aminodeoxychorismate synthase component I [Gammaproteobacteria bacterium]MCC8995420.1 aminodeoxychorismate synthase component I [Candidatus Contendobacter sp.]
MMTNTIVIQQGQGGFQLSQPVTIVIAHQADEVIPALQAIEAAVNQHRLYAAGFLCYEAAAAYDLAGHAPFPEVPLLWFGLYEQATPIRDWPALIAQAAQRPVGAISDWHPTISLADYEQAFDRIKHYLAAGHSYQVNYTFPLHADFSGDPWVLFARLATAQQAEYAAFIDTGRLVIGSASPELFFQIDGERLTAKPMKGTALRGCTLVEDQAQIAGLQQSAKNRAENLMVVDMLRNDLGRVAHIGSVAVPQLFAVERYPTLLQMTSTVTARTRVPIAEILAHLFPCASITGAPKVRTMQIIRELEPGPRGVYTGAVGFIGPNRQARFNVAIRTVLIDQQRQQARYGVGSGLVWDSNAADEYAECRLKARVLTTQRPSFQLLEALLWEPDHGYFLRAAHGRRLAETAAYFGVALDQSAIETGLTDLAQTLSETSKIRVCVAMDGRFTLEAEPLAQAAALLPLRVGLARDPVNSSTVWLYHKTTRREIYAAARATRPECDEVILWNERGELTEASSANLVLDLAGDWVTPSVTSGLLAGTFRGELLAQGRIREQALTGADLRRADHIFLINSVRRWQNTILVNESPNRDMKQGQSPGG